MDVSCLVMAMCSTGDAAGLCLSTQPVLLFWRDLPNVGYYFLSHVTNCMINVEGGGATVSREWDS